MDNRQIWIDFIKGVTIICVVIAHACGSMYNSQMFDNSWTRGINIACNAFIMPLFFTVSGYLFENAYVTWNRGKSLIQQPRWKKQIVNLVIIYFFYSSIQAFTKIIFSSEVTDVISFQDILKLPICSMQQYWYIYVLFLLYLLVPLILDYLNSKLLVIMLLISIVYSIIDFRTSITAMLIFYYSFFFCYGIVYSHGMKNVFVENRIVVFLQFLISIFAMYLLLVGYSEGIHKVLIGFTLTNVLIYICKKINATIQSLKFINYIGAHSMEIYLLHYYITSGCRPIIRVLNIKYWWEAIVLLTVGGVAIPLLVSSILNKLNMWNFFFKPVVIINKIKEGWN